MILLRRYRLILYGSAILGLVIVSFVGVQLISSPSQPTAPVITTPPIVPAENKEDEWASAQQQARKYLRVKYESVPWVEVDHLSFSNDRNIAVFKGSKIDTEQYLIVSASYKAFLFTVLVERHTGQVVDDHVMK